MIGSNVGTKEREETLIITPRHLPPNAGGEWNGSSASRTYYPLCEFELVKLRSVFPKSGRYMPIENALAPSERLMYITRQETIWPHL